MKDPSGERRSLTATDPMASIDPEAIGERLMLARRASGMTQQQVADALSIARTTITAIEGGVRRPRPQELVRLAELFRRPVSDLLRAATRPGPISFDVFFRSTGTKVDLERDSKLAADVQRFEQFCRWYVELETELDAPLPHRYPAPYENDRMAPSIEQSAEDVAAAERNRLGLGDGPIGDIYSLLETDVGLRIFAFPFEASQVAGMFLYHPDLGGCIAVNARHPEVRRRWTLVHEYSHFLTDRNKAEVSILSGKRIPPEERWADAFAKHFLMPGIGLGRRFDAMQRAKAGEPTPADVLILAHLYRVSFEAMIRRLEEIQRLPSGAWKHLLERGFEPGKAKRYLPLSPYEPDPILPRRYELLAAKAFDAEKLTGGELARRLDRDRVDALARVEELTSEYQLTDGEWRQLNLDLNSALVGAGAR
jgi:Zn-dependent peptidase ImmA (M78 family)/transcriptional regulator with XRE-family HTH domain